jgi:hypothetical protein
MGSFSGAYMTGTLEQLSLYCANPLKLLNIVSFLKLEQSRTLEQLTGTSLTK